MTRFLDSKQDLRDKTDKVMRLIIVNLISLMIKRMNKIVMKSEFVTLKGFNYIISKIGVVSVFIMGSELVHRALTLQHPSRTSNSQILLTMSPTQPNHRDTDIVGDILTSFLNRNRIRINSR